GPPDAAAQRVLLPVHAVGGHRRAHVALAARSGRRALRLLPPGPRAAGRVAARRPAHRDGADHPHPGRVGHRPLPRDLPGRAPGHPPRAVRGGLPGRRDGVAELPGHHPAAPPAGVALRLRHPHHRLVPDLRAGVRPDPGRPRRRHPHGGPAPVRDGVPELLPVRRGLGHGVGALRADRRLLAAAVPPAPRSHRVLMAAAAPSERPVRRGTARRAALTGGLLALAVLWLTPAVWVLVTSLKPTPDIVRLPPQWIPWPATLEHYGEVLFSSSRTVRIGRAFLNSAIVALGSVALVVFTSALTAYPLARMRFRGRGLVFGLVVGSLMIPNAVVLVPQYVLTQRLG